VAFVGRLVPWKRVDRIVEAVARAAGRQHVKVLVVGSGPEEQRLRSLVETRGLRDRIGFLGTRDDVDEILARTDVLVQPSTAEPFGLAIIEACGRGVLPIAFADGGGALEVVPPDGIVVSSVDELASVLSAIPASPRLGLEARRERARWARERFSIANTADAYLDLYRAAIDERA
jgi:glycosyltransferase involved in cell wall biosynthesis